MSKKRAGHAGSEHSLAQPLIHGVDPTRDPRSGPYGADSGHPSHVGEEPCTSVVGLPQGGEEHMLSAPQ